MGSAPPQGPTRVNTQSIARSALRIGAVRKIHCALENGQELHRELESRHQFRADTSVSKLCQGVAHRSDTSAPIFGLLV